MSPTNTRFYLMRFMVGRLRIISGWVVPAFRFGKHLLQQTLHEEILQPTLTIRAARPAPATGHNQEVKVLLRLDQRIHKPIRGLGRYVGVKFTHHQQQVPLQMVRIGDVGGFRVVRSYGRQEPIHCSFHEALSMRLS